MNGKKVSDLATGKKRRITSFDKGDVASEWTLKVEYQKGVSNEGTFKTKKATMEALKTWTEKDLVAYASKGEFV